MTLEIFLLGQFKLKANDIPFELPSRPAQSLLAYLAINAGSALRREKLASLLWSKASEENARAYLRQALWRIRKSLENNSLCWENYLSITEISIAFNHQANYWLDTDQLQRSTEGCSTEELVEDVRLYRGEFLPGFYEEWVVLERDRLQAIYHKKMNQLLERFIQARRWDDVLYWGERWISYGFSPEPAYRALLKAYAGLGNQGMLGITYQRCKEALRRDLEVDPSPETNRLYEQLQKVEPDGVHTPSSIHSRPVSPAPFFVQKGQTHLPEKTIVVARERELEHLDQFLSQVIGGQGSILRLM